MCRWPVLSSPKAVVRPRTPLEALKAQTINVAYQYGEQASKGSLEAGKLADLAILDGNP